MSTLIALAVLGAAMAVVVWMVRIGQRDFRAARASARPRETSLRNLTNAQLAGVLGVLPLLAFFWWGPPVLTWVGTIYLVGVCIVLGLALYVPTSRLRDC